MNTEPGQITRKYTLLVYWDQTRVGHGTVLEDHTIDLLISQANRWVGPGRWNRLELAPYIIEPTA